LCLVRGSRRSCASRAHPEADLGVHLALTSEWTTFRWRPLTAAEQVPSLLDEDGYLTLSEMTVGKRARPEEAEKELRAQIELARKAGIRITHFDSHMNSLHQTGALLEVYRKLARENNVPIRWDRTMPVPAGSTMPPDEVLVDATIALDASVDPNAWRSTYENLLAPLPPGVYLMVVHLGYADEEMWGATVDHPDWGAAWRRYDLELVRSPEFRRFLKDQGFVVVTWKDLARALPAAQR
jgi:chitin disaccharide deacetylase